MKSFHFGRLWLTEFWRDEMGRHFANNEKKAHVKKVNKLVANGGTYVEYMARTVSVNSPPIVPLREVF